MQSFVSHRTQRSASRTRTSSGETVEAAKLNWPMGQTHFQKGAFLKVESTITAPPK